ncbi:MAG: isoaspartyl peptidase/L-asparaginase, partial [Planctomycetes bacterium]|nr:isoaspartyl peptidase/L-asparaginase [Planctomycetota bacterium]
MADLTRRGFLHSAAAASVGALAPSALGGTSTAGQSPGAPVVISSANGLATTTKAAEIIRGGGDTLDAVIAGVNIVEIDPDDHSVGYGGLPNEVGIVELDSCVMHGP